MIEVEIKLKISNKENVLQGLLDLGFVEADALKETDQYFDNADGQMKLGDSALRIRNVTDLKTDISTTQITFKGKKSDVTTMTRPEFETSVGEAMTMEKILNSLGFYVVEPSVVKVRHEYCLEKITACLDCVEGLGDYLELEIMVDKEQDKSEALKQIDNVLSKLGFSMKDTTTISYLSQLQNNM